MEQRTTSAMTRIGGMRIAWCALACSSVFVACDGNDGSEDLVDTRRPDVSDVAEVLDTGAPGEVSADGGDAAGDAIDQEVGVDQNQLRNGVSVRIAHIVDGDTFDVIVGIAEPRLYTIRMRGLSAPECFKGGMQTPWGWRYACDADDEYWGLASYQALYAMLDGRTAWLTCDTGEGDWCPTDFYDRYLAYVEVDGLDAATEMARGGHGFAYTDYGSSKRAQICAAEYDAIAAPRGMWELGSVDAVLAGMNGSTRTWYLEHHDARCDAAIAAERTSTE